MNILKLIKEALAKKSVTSKELELVKKGFEKLDTEEKEVINDEYKKFLELKIKEEDDEEEKGEEEDEDLGEVQKQLKTLLNKEAKEMKDVVKDEIIEKVNELFKEHKKMAETKSGFYNDAVAEKRASIKAKTRALAEAVVNQDDTKMKEMTTDGSGTPYAGYVVDSELSAEIRRLITEYGVARREMMSIQLSKGSYKANNLATDVTVYWVDEAGSIKSTQAVLGQETLELKKLATIATMTSELLQDEEIDLSAFLLERVAEGMAKMEDEAFFKGDGTTTYGSFTGLLENASVNEITLTGTTFASMDADDLISMVDDTPQGALRNAKFYMNRTIMSIVRKLKDDNGQYIYQAPSQTGPATIWGYPVVLVEAMPNTGDTAVDTSFVLFGDLKKACIFGYKGGINAKRFDAGTVRNVAGSADLNLITSDREAIRWTERVGYIVIIATAVTKLTTASSSA